MVSSFTESRCAESAAAATAAAAAPTSSWPRLRCWLRGAAARPGETRAGVAALTSPSFSCLSETAMRGSRSAVHLRRHLGFPWFANRALRAGHGGFFSAAAAGNRQALRTRSLRRHGAWGLPDGCHGDQEDARPCTHGACGGTGPGAFLMVAMAIGRTPGPAHRELVGDREDPVPAEQGMAASRSLQPGSRQALQSRVLVQMDSKNEAKDKKWRAPELEATVASGEDLTVASRAKVASRVVAGAEDKEWILVTKLGC
ncbi:hypothetical protein QTO34_007952 [Cnephaeus nilssonii]|uniref:Uncharacterized protein n=1 Tax=Cnephaeus nilssonii TaxID=3371016 RepID=A0AA40LTQ5_CNENI|nr:hypothetical protein QTO34_007952 [Eptesicus nilssonii]